MKSILAFLLLLCGIATAQSTVQCGSFPCSITAAQCNNTLPCSLNLVQAPNKFNLGDTVYVKNAPSNLSVRMGPALTAALIGTQPNGRTAVIVGGPTIDSTGDNKIRWQLDYAIGVDGWSVEDYLEKHANQPPPLPAPALTLTPPSLSFPSQAIGSPSQPQRVLFKNTGTANLIISTRFVDAGDFQSSGSCVAGTPYAPGTNCFLDIVFKPTGSGTRPGSVTLTTNAPGSPHQIVLTGIGATVPIPANVKLTWFAPASGSAASYNLYRGGVKIGSVTGSTLTFTNTAVPSGTYVYTARTVDAAGRESQNSTSATVTIP